MIKKLIIFSLIGIMGISFLCAQHEDNLLLEQRESSYQKYIQYKDTMTVRTWINMVNLVERLENVVKIDNSIIDKVGDNSEETSLSEAEKKLLTTRQTLDQLIIQNNKIKNDKDIAQKRLFSVAVIAGLLIIALIIIIFISVSIRVKYKKIENDFRVTNDELLKVKDQKVIDENDVRSKIENAVQEKELIENNLQEVKKAFKALKVEKEFQSQNSSGIDRETYKELAEEFNVLKSEIKNIIIEKQELEQSIKEMSLKHNHELESRKQIENELKAILERIK